MKRKDEPFKQFAKDCKEHFSKDVLLRGHLREPISQDENFRKFCFYKNNH